LFIDLLQSLKITACFLQQSTIWGCLGSTLNLWVFFFFFWVSVFSHRNSLYSSSRSSISLFYGALKCVREGMSIHSQLLLTFIGSEDKMKIYCSSPKGRQWVFHSQESSRVRMEYVTNPQWQKGTTLFTCKAWTNTEFSLFSCCIFF
jgi:hypothetical protein